ncbi:Acetyl-coenzyme A synthetase, cytoplasmic [Dermatophagoides farinae]|uniref:Acetyl-coenzyme A synthetase n=1 Tax=Dermatophagoides farinae TaxID=6954 RepID=A0A922HMT6_DERFA|nr:Acetyl-coenzyme A synthetase, cytoplasmic [Dermatophagoides farinae]
MSEFCDESIQEIIRKSLLESMAQVERVPLQKFDSNKANENMRQYEQYQRMYEHSIKSPGTFWKQIATDFYWTTPLPLTYHKILEYNFDYKNGPIKVDFFKGMKTNITYNLLDRVINCGFGERIAYHWIGNDLNEKKKITYSELKNQVCRLANYLKQTLKIGIGDRVAIYLPVTIELIISMLACARIGAIHTVVFAGFSANALAERMINAKCKMLITADASFRGDKFLHFQPIIDNAIQNCLAKKCDIQTIIMVNRFETTANRHKQRYNDIVQKHQSPHSRMIILWDKILNDKAINDICEPEWVDAEHPLFILYTSGSTGKPKGILHTVAGYMLSTATAFKYAFNYHDGDVFFCTADIGWITGHTASVYGALANGATIIVYEGIPTHPRVDRFWMILNEYKVNIFYTSPTAIRSLMKFGERYVKSYSMRELRLIALVGEPVNRHTWFWIYRYIGKESCPIVDTYFQTETGAPMIFPVPYIVDLKPGSATIPWFGVVPVILDDNGKEITGTDQGNLAYKQAWPGMARTIDGDAEIFETTYFKKFPGYFFTGDGAFRDTDGHYWITGRIDDLLNVSGHLLSTAEVEAALLNDKRLAEAAAVAIPHTIKGQAICAFIVLKQGYSVFDLVFQNELIAIVRQEIGPIATPEIILNVRSLPKTRSDKIMRRVLALFVLHIDRLLQHYLRPNQLQHQQQQQQRRRRRRRRRQRRQRQFHRLMIKINHQFNKRKLRK